MGRITKRIQRADFRAGKKHRSAEGPRNKKGPGFQNNKRAKNVNAQPGRFNSVHSTSGTSLCLKRCLALLVELQQVEACSR